MNFEFNVFGKNENKYLYYKPEDEELLRQIAERSPVESQLTIYRIDACIYYVYIKRLSERENFFGFCLKFNGVYCNDNKKFFDLFEETIKDEVELNKKILNLGFNRKIIFASNNFSRNEVDIDNLDAFFHRKINEDFENDFSDIDASFDQANKQQQYLSFKDSHDYIIKSIKKYNYVTLTINPIKNPYSYLKFEERIINFKQNYTWVNYISAISLVSLSSWLVLGLVQQSFSFFKVLMLEIPIVLCFYFLSFGKFTKGRNEILLAVFSFIISILGVALTIDNSVFSSSDGKYSNIIKRSFKKDNIVDLSSNIKECDNTPWLVFVLDVSGSTKRKKYGNQEDAKELFKDVCRRLRGDTTKIKKVLKDFLKKYDKNCFQYTEYNVYKLKILDIISHNKEQYKDKIHIVCFAGDVESRKVSDCNEVIKFINNIESNKEFIDNNRTDFIKLIEKLTESFYLKSSKNVSKAPKYTFLFFSDYLHDVGKKISSKEKKKIIDSINTEISNFYSKQNFSNYFFTNPLLNVESDTEIPVFNIFKELVNENSKAHFLKIENEEYDFMDLLPTTFIPIYYEHSFPDKCLNTTITFTNIIGSKKARISLKTNPQSVAEYHQQFTLLEKDSTLVFPSKEVEISPTNPLTLSFCGRIIDNYSSALLTIQSESRNYSRFDVVFFKDLPPFVRYVMATTLFFFFLFVLSMIILFINRWNDFINLFKLK